MARKDEGSSVVPSDTPTGDALVFEYGIRLDKESIEAVNKQILLSRRLYNDIVAEIRSAVNSAHAFIVEKAGGNAVTLQQEIDSLTDEFKSARAANDEERMRCLAQQRREKWAALGQLLQATRKTFRSEVQAQFLSRIGRNSSCQTYQLRCAAVAGGLGWGTANAVLDAALQAFKKSFARGRPPTFARGTEIAQDCLTLQFTMAGGVPAQALLEGRHSDVGLRPSNGCGRRKYGEFRFRLGAAKENVYATGTWQYHRPLPADASIALARLVRRRIGSQYRWAVQLLVKPTEPVRVAVGERKPLVAIHFGWSADLSGRRVAAIADAADPGAARVIALPPSIEADLERASEIQGTRDAARDAIVGQVRALALPDGASEYLTERMARLRKTRSQDVSANHLHHLCHVLRNEASVPEWLEVWRREDKRRWEQQAHIARSARNRRKEFYRELATKLAREYSVLAIEPLDLAVSAQKVDERTGEKNKLGSRARSGRVVAALYEFESALRWAAAKAETAVLEVRGQTATVCGICGAKIEAAEDNYQILHCHGCGAVLDRKQNGAAVAWCLADEERETATMQFWIDRCTSLADRQAQKAEKLAKMAEGRRKASQREPEVAAKTGEDRGA